VEVALAAEVEIHPAVPEPAAAATSERLGADDLGEAEHVDVELARAALFPIGDDELHVLDAEKIG
jgi:hypothetical protein